jgi:hypothetical protein
MLLEGVMVWKIRVKTLGFGMAGAGDGDVSYVLEGIIEVNLQAPSANLRGKPQIHGSDDVGALTSFSSLGASILEVCIKIDHGWFFGGVVFFYCVDGGGSWRRGAAGSQRWACDDGLAQEGGAVWHHGGVDGRSDKIDAWIPVLKKV